MIKIYILSISIVALLLLSATPALTSLKDEEERQVQNQYLPRNLPPQLHKEYMTLIETPLNEGPILSEALFAWFEEQAAQTIPVPKKKLMTNFLQQHF